MKKKIVFLFMFIIMIFCEISQAKYVIEQTILIAKVNIDTIVPKIELMNITSTEDKENQNKKHKINMQIKVIEGNIKQNHFNKENIKINVEGAELNKEFYEMNKIQEADNYIIYEIQIHKIMIEGQLEIIIPVGIIQDYADNKNEEKIIKNNL